MIKRQSIWALTLFSLILVLSIYYITLPEELEVSYTDNEEIKTVITEEESDVISMLKIEKNEEKEKKKKEIQEILTKEDSTKEEKNNAYEELKLLNILSSKEDELSLKIKDSFKVDNVVEINDDKVKVTLLKKDHTTSLASEIMDFVQSNFEDKMYISVKFTTEEE